MLADGVECYVQSSVDWASETGPTVTDFQASRASTRRICRFELCGCDVRERVRARLSDRVVHLDPPQDADTTRLLHHARPLATCDGMEGGHVVITANAVSVARSVGLLLL